MSAISNMPEKFDAEVVLARLLPGVKLPTRRQYTTYRDPLIIPHVVTQRMNERASYFQQVKEIEEEGDRKLRTITAYPLNQCKATNIRTTYEANGIVYGAAQGALVGLGVGSIGGPPGMIAGVVVGFVGGGVGGFVIGRKVAQCYVASLTQYKYWINTEEGSRYANRLHVLLSEASLDRNVRCSYTHRPVISGLRDSEGNLYEEYVLVENNGTCIDPEVPTPEIVLDQTFRDPNVCLRKAHDFLNIIDKLSPYVEKSEHPEVRAGLRALRADWQDSFTRFHGLYKNKIEQAHREGRMDDTRYRVSSTIVRRFYQSHPQD